MLENLGNLKTSEIELRQQVPMLACDWLVDRLLTKQGVAAAEWGRDTHRLLVEYDADLCCGAELIAFLQDCGFPVAAARVGFGVSISSGV
jgi:hypothetical protein